MIFVPASRDPDLALRGNLRVREMDLLFRAMYRVQIRDTLGDVYCDWGIWIERVIIYIQSLKAWRGFQVSLKIVKIINY